MRIALIFPPPWQIPAIGTDIDRFDFPPPQGDASLGDTDSWTIPYGVLSIAAQAIRAGHEVACHNLATTSWTEVEGLVKGLNADLFGLSCLTFNRRGTAALANLIREVHPQAHITVGGQHVTSLPIEMLAHYPSIDSIMIGESEETFLELVGRLEAGSSTQGIRGTAYRDGDKVLLAETRPRLKELDRLVSPHKYFSNHVILTSRGCPWQCTYCASEVMWNRKVEYHSVGRVLEEIEQEVKGRGVRILAFKDDTFTAHRKRAIEVCKTIEERGLRFAWSCDTRVDSLDEEVLRAMRRAGCSRISLGVESGSPEILKRIRKKTTPTQVLEATRLAKKFGFEIRFYFIVGNPGETMAHFQQTYDLFQAAQPHSASFCWLTIYPGTEEFNVVSRQGRISAETYFAGDFSNIRAAGDFSPQEADQIQEWTSHTSTQTMLFPYSVEEYQQVVERLPDVPAVHVDMAGVFIRNGRAAEARAHLIKARELGYPLWELVDNYEACICITEGRYADAAKLLEKAAENGQFRVVVKNHKTLNEWLAAGGERSKIPLNMLVENNFEMAVTMTQPLFPGPLESRYYSESEFGLPNSQRPTRLKCEARVASPG